MLFIIKRIRIASGTRVRTGSGTRRTILKRSWTSAGPYLPQIRFADPIQFRADVRLDNGPSPFGGSGPDRLLAAAQIRPNFRSQTSWETGVASMMQN
ncbi:hypothetical protein JOQ06_002344, partial [Pogonophryne albipinna]